MKLTLIVSLICLLSSPVLAQYCPLSGAKGVHTVQKGETLYGLSRVYKTTVAQLCKWNGIQEADILPLCTNLTVSGDGVAKASNDVPASYAYTPTKKAKAMPYFKSNAKTHFVKQEETLDMIAEYYGYTRARLMYMNNIRNANNYYVGQQLVVNDCDAANASYSTTNENVAPVAAAPSHDVSHDVSHDMSADVPRSYGIVTESYISTTTSSSTTTPYGNPNYSWNPAYKRVIHVVSQNQLSQNETVESVGRLHGLSAAEVIAMNNLRSNVPLFAGQRLVVEERLEAMEAVTDGFYASTTPSTPTPTPPQYTASLTDNSIPNNYNTTSYMNAASTPAPEVSNTTSMTKDEMSMVNEINLIRSNPAGYIMHIEKYIADLQKEEGNKTTIATARELISELFKLPNLSTLQPMECIYSAAKKNGIDQIKRGIADHQGTDGSMPWDRILRECPSLKDGNENLVGGPKDIRTAVITLLVDDGIPSRGHRRTLLQANWKYVACHKMGTIGGIPNYWTQQFGN